MALDETDFDFRLVSNAARQAFNAEIMPYIEDLKIMTPADLEAVYRYFKDKVLVESRSQNDHQTYSRLIRYKTIDTSDDQYFNDLESVLTSWYDRAKARMENPNEQVATS